MGGAESVATGMEADDCKPRTWVTELVVDVVCFAVGAAAAAPPPAACGAAETAAVGARGAPNESVAPPLGPLGAATACGATTCVVGGGRSLGFTI